MTDFASIDEAIQAWRTYTLRSENERLKKFNLSMLKENEQAVKLLKQKVERVDEILNGLLEIRDLNDRGGPGSRKAVRAICDKVI